MKLMCIHFYICHLKAALACLLESLTYDQWVMNTISHNDSLETQFQFSVRHCLRQYQLCLKVLIAANFPGHLSGVFYLTT